MNEYTIILTIHNKDFLVRQSLERIKQYTTGLYEIVVVLDGCRDNSAGIVQSFINKNPKIKIKVEVANDVFETKANNIGLKRAESKYCIIVQDDMLINEPSWNVRLKRPFDEFNDVFAVTANCSHNWKFNPNSVHLNLKENLTDCWCDIINHTDHAGKAWNLSRDIFAVRQSANRGPLMINHEDLIKLNYFDETFAPLDMDDHDLCFRAKKKLNKIVGCYWIDFISDFRWGGTHTSTGHKPWFYESNHKNTKILWNRHSNLINEGPVINNRKLI